MARMASSRLCLLLTCASAALLVGGCATTTDGTAAPSPQTVTTTTHPTTPPRTTGRTPAPTTTTAVPAAQVAEYAGGTSGSYYFTSPSTKFECAVITAPQPVAGCHGKLPGTAPQVPVPGGPGTTAPNAIRVNATKPGEFTSTGDPAFHRFDGPVKALPYGSPLRVQGFTCTVDARAGVTCESGAGHGFTVSDNDYRLW